ncbi:hypothetical protein HK405_007993, partial [Cladochytrium tenue]
MFPRAFNGHTLETAIILALYIPVLGIFGWSYYKVVTTSPGVPKNDYRNRRRRQNQPAHLESGRSGVADPEAQYGPVPSLSADESASEAATAASLIPKTGGRGSVDGGTDIEDEDDDDTERIRASTAVDIDDSGGPTEMPGLALAPLEVKGNGSRRYCQKCRFFKPDRTHH